MRRRDGVAALLFLLASFLRELSAPVLVLGLVAAHLEGRDRRPWLASLLVFSIGFTLHMHVASGLIAPPGNDAILWGTGVPPETVLVLFSWLLPGPTLLWLGAWCIAVWQAWRRRLLVLLSPILGLPMLGIFVNRPYWSVVVIPFVLLLAGEFVAERFTGARARARGAEESSPPVDPSSPAPGTPAPVLSSG